MAEEQLSLFEEKETIEKGKLTRSYEINWHNIIGVDKGMENVKGYVDLSDKAQELLKYLIINHAKQEDGFIHAEKLCGLMKIWSGTRELRKLCAEIDFNTEYVVYSSQNGYKLAANRFEIGEAVKFALAPAMTAIRRTFAKNKIETLHWLHGFIGNLEKEFGGNIQGQKEMTEDMEIREVNHYPERADIDYMPSIDERIEYYEKIKNKKL